MIFALLLHVNDDLLADTPPGSKDRCAVAGMIAENANDAVLQGLVWYGAKPNMGSPDLLNGLQERCQ